MQDFGQYPYGSLDDFLDDPLYDDPFEDPFEAMLNAGLLGNAEADIESTPPIRLGPDGICRTLGRLEKGIENSPPIRSGPDDIGKMLGQLEKNIENTSIPPEPKIDMELFEDPGWGRTTSSINTPSPPPGIYDNPAIQSTRDGRPVGQRGGRIKNKPSTDREVWCPIADDYIQKEDCENCQYYDQDTDVCTYYGEEEPDTDSQDDETNENSDY